MEKQIQTKQLPKKTIVYIALLIVAGILSMYIIKDGKARKATKVLHQLGFKQVKDVVVFSKTKFINEKTNIKGYQYALKFIDLSTNQSCKGFILRDFKGNANKDLICKKWKNNG